ncbi:MAG: M1 family metallopeptidase, partial [bacterium]|nr:M1 family metallopeptidase [bacterium]
MIRAIVGFELRYQLRRPLWWLITLVFFVLAFGAGSSFVIEIAGARGHVVRNAPVVTAQMLGALSILALLLNTAFVAGAILRDFDCRSAELIFSRPMRRLDYLLGRFLGGLLVSSGAFMAAVAGLTLGTMMPWIDPEQLGPFLLSPYVWVVLVVVLPNLFLLATLFFCLAALSRSMLVTYLGAVVSWAAFFLSFRMRYSIESRYLAALIDPFGLGALGEVTEYWTIVEKNTLLPELAGTLLHNRLLWLGIGLALLAVTLCCFRYRSAGGGRGWRRRPRPVESAGALGVAATTVALPRVEPTFGRATAWRQFFYQARAEVLGVITGTPFLVLLALGIYKLISVGRYAGVFYGTPTHPMTHLMIANLGRTFGFLLLIIITFYAGELLQRERRLNLSEMFDAMPAPGWVFLGAKLTALMATALVYLGVGVLTQISVQIYYGHDYLELGLYARSFVVHALPFLLACFLALFLQVAAGNKFVGYLLMIPYLISGRVMGVLDFNHRLYDFGHAPAAPYSDLNGYGHFVAPLFWFNLYWAFAAAILAVLALLLRTRGTDTGLSSRLRTFRRRFRRPQRLALAAAVAGFVATGGWIFYNTNVLNEYLPRDRIEARQADYEEKYRRHLELPQPRVTEVAVEVDLYPSERRVEARGRYLLVNRHDAPIRELHCTIPPEVRVNSLTLPAYRRILHDPVHGYRIWRLERPLEPGESIEMGFDLTVERRGFVAFDPNRSDTRIVHNGTSFYDSLYFPQFGYHPGPELQDANLRRKYGLPPVHPMAAVDDLEARRHQLESRDADWIDFEATISTSADQIAVAPGYLEKEWTEGDRRYFHYRMDVPMLRGYCIESAAYRVMRERWGEVAIEIYHHPSHTYNLERMSDAVRKTLAYCSENFGPYQFRQLRIIETPGYSSGAASFPNTIPYSETAGFIARVEGDRLDYPFYITAHEVAHQWWGHQVVPGNVQGAHVLTETLAQYSALMV